MNSFKISQFDYSFLKGFKARELVSISILHIISCSVILLLSDSGITLKDAPIYFLAKGVAFVIFYSLGAYFTAYFVLKNSSKDHLEIRRDYKIFLRLFFIVLIILFLHLMVGVSIVLIIFSLSTVPDWLVGTTDYSALNVSEITLDIFLRNLAVFPAYIIHTIFFSAYFYIFNQNAKVFESLYLCICSLGTLVIWLTCFLSLTGFVTEILEHLAPDYLYWATMMISSLLTCYIYSGVFLSRQKINEKKRSDQGTI